MADKDEGGEYECYVIHVRLGVSHVMRHKDES